MSTVNLNGLPRQQDGCDLDNYPRKKSHLWSWRSGKGSVDGTQPGGGRTLPRGWKQKKQNSLVDYCDPLRTTFILEKQDNESFGFEIQTYGLQLSNHPMVEMCTFVCMVHQGSAADCAGLTTGEVILTVNGQSIEGSPHHHVVDAVRQSGNTLKIETVCGTVMKRIELEKKMSLLKQTLREKWEELQNLVFQEEQLTGGGSTDSTLSRSSVDSLLSPDPFTGRHGCHGDGSYWSAVAADGDQASVFGDGASTPSPRSAPAVCDDDGGDGDGEGDRRFFSQSFPDRSEFRRKIKSSGSFSVNSSSSCSGSSVSSPPYWDEGRASSVFGTLPRKARKGSVRRHLLRLIPGLQRSVEQDVEEELDPGRPCSLHCD